MKMRHVAAAIALYGHSYSSTTSLEGIRDVSGLNNNLLHTTATLGAVDQPFRRDVAANFAGYLQPTDALAPNAFYASKVYHQTVNASVAANGDITFHYTTGAPDRVLSATIGDLNYDAGYAALYDATASLDTVTSVSINAHTGELTFQYATLAPGVVLLTSIPAYNADLAGQITSDGTTLLRHSASGATTPAQPVAPDYATTVDGLGVVHQSNVIDYTARMISLTTTTAGATPLLDAQNHVVNWDTALYASDTTYQALIDSTGINIATLVEGAAIVTGYGLLETLGHKDFQKAPGTEGSNEYFIGGENPGVAPTNGWFALFGQFFDHGLDLIGKGGQGTTIKIALATDDPLYGVIGSDGRPNTSITISRATVSGKDANGDPTYINHTSPFIDQSQTYGSDAQTTALLREWVSSDGGTSYHAGMAMFDGQTLATQWKRADGVMTNQTLPTLNELRDHVLDTNRDGISWEDVLDLRNRDTNGDVVSGTSGHALILDINPRFDGSHLDAGTPIGNGTDTVDLDIIA